MSDVKGAVANLVYYGKDRSCLAVTHLRKCSSWQYRYLMSDRRATISAWQSLRARPLSLMYSPLMHFVPVDTQMTSASFTSAPEQEGTQGTSISHNIKNEVKKVNITEDNAPYHTAKKLLRNGRNTTKSLRRQCGL